MARQTIRKTTKKTTTKKRTVRYGTKRKCPTCGRYM